MSVNFDDKAKTWEDDANRARGKHLAAALKEQIALQPSWHVVEIGAGTGVVGRQLSDVVEKVTLVDESVEMMKMAQEMCAAEGRGNVQTAHGTLAEYSAAPQQVADVILAVMSLHHIVDLQEAVTQLVSVTKPGGYVCIIDLYENDGAFHKDVEGFDGHDGFNMRSLAHLFEEQGCKITYADTVFEDAHTTKHGKVGFRLFMLIVQRAS